MTQPAAPQRTRPAERAELRRLREEDRLARAELERALAEEEARRKALEERLRLMEDGTDGAAGGEGYR